MKKVETNNHKINISKNTVIGNTSRSVEISKPKRKKCSGCSRSSRKNNDN